MVKQCYYQNVLCQVLKKSRLMKEQETKGILSSVGLKTPLSKIPLLGDILFWNYKINEIVNKYLLVVDKVMPEMHLKKPGFTYSACGPFTENRKRIQKFKETGDSRYIYRNEFDKACFQHDMAHWNFKDLARRTDSDKVLKSKAFTITKNPKCDGYQRGIASMVHNFFRKKV